MHLRDEVLFENVTADVRFFRAPIQFADYPAIPYFVIVSKPSIPAFILLFLSLSTKAQSNLDILRSRDLFKEGTHYMEQALDPKKDSLQVIELNRRAALLFEASYKADSNNSMPLLFLPDAWYSGRKYAVALHWALKRLSAEKDQTQSDNYIYLIGLCYIQLGNLDSGKAYIKNGLDLSAKKNPQGQGNLLVQELKDISDRIFYGSDTAQMSLLASLHVNPCKYSVEILQYADSLDTQHYFVHKLIPERLAACQ